MECFALIQVIKDKLYNDELILPTLPDVALATSKLLSKQDTDLKTIVAHIQRDAALSARVIKFANTALLKGRVSIDSVSQAVVRIGLKNINRIVIAFAMEQLYFAKHINTAILLSEIWQQARTVTIKSAALYHLINSANNKDDKLCDETLFLISLIHNIGALTILSEIDRADICTDDDCTKQKLRMIIEQLDTVVAERVLTQWNFSTEVIHAATEWRSICNPETELSYKDILQCSMINTSYLDTKLSNAAQAKLISKYPHINEEWNTSDKFINSVNELEDIF